MMRRASGEREQTGKRRLQPAVVDRASRISPQVHHRQHWTTQRQCALNNTTVSLTSDIMERSSQRVIHAYAHVRTNQVLYSFTPNLHVSISPVSHIRLHPADFHQNASIARQFPDTGANTSFTHLRKDLWRPLWTLSIPEGKHADAQGRHAFKKLREWRKLHETSWEPPALLALNHSKKEIERMQDQLDQRGGSKKNNVYDVIRHKKKKLRVAAVLDQRANSVADLAAVLAAQEALGAKTQQHREEEAKERRDFQVQTMLDLARRAEQGGLAAIDARLTELKEIEAKADRLGEPMEISKAQMSREVKELNARQRKMHWSADAVKTAREEVKEKNGNLSPEQQEARVREILPSFPTPNASVPKRGSLHNAVARANAPVFSTEGIVIKWANQLDAEYAESWPETVSHAAMGLSRHRAPAAEQEAVMTVAELRTQRLQRGQSSVDDEAQLSHEEKSQRQGFNEAKGQILSMVKQAVAKRAERVARKERQRSAAQS